MRRRRLTVVLLIILLVFGAGFYAISILNPSETVTSIFDLENGSIIGIHIASRDKQVSFEKHEEQWAMVEPAPHKTDAQMVSRIADKLESLDALRVIEKRADNLSKYGLDEPDLSVTVSLKNGRDKTLLIGEETASRYQYYVKDSQRDAVYTISLTDVETLGKGDPSVFRDRTLIFIDKEKINLFCLYHNGKREMVLLQYKTGKWEFSEPFRTSAGSDAVTDILKRISSLKIKDFIEDNPSDLSKYGLERPAYSIEIGDQNGNIQKILFGSTNVEKNEAFVCLENAKEVYTVPADDFDPKNVNISDLLSEAPLSVAIDSVKTIMINDRGMVCEFERDTSRPEEEIFTYKGEIIKEDDLIALYVNMMALTSDGYDANDVERTPETTIIYKSLVGNYSIKLELSARDDKSYFLTVDDEPLPFYVSAQKVDLVRRWLAKIVENMS